MNDKAEKKCSVKFEGSILLMVMPFWTPIIPPLGIASLKGYLTKKNYDVRTFDMNINEEVLDIQFKYYNILKNFVPESNRGNFFNIGNDVFHNHAMIHINYVDKEEYCNLLKQLIKNTFAVNATDEHVNKLISVIESFYKILDQEIDKLLNLHNPKILGLSVYRGNLAASVYIARKAKKFNKDILVFMGGGIFADQLAIGSDNFNYFLEISKPFIDKFMIGEGELLFEHILENELYSEKRYYTLEDIDTELLDIENVEYPDFSDFQVDKYPHMTTYTSRSCPFQCKFCSETVQWGKYRNKSAKRVVEEMSFLAEKHNSQLFLLGDSLLNPVVKGLSEEFSKLDKALYWDGYLRAEEKVCDLKNTEAWRRGGFYRARLGVESGSQRVLNLMNKKIDIDLIKRSLYSLATAGIKTTTYWVIGFPGETEEDFQETLKLIEEVKDYIWEAECNPFGFYPAGQISSNQWANNSRKFYADKYRDMLVVEPWEIISNPSREEKFKRVYLFAEHCNKLGIPNPYSFKDLYEADKRWHKLHKNAVPYLFEFVSKDKYIDECKNLQGDKMNEKL